MTFVRQMLVNNKTLARASLSLRLHDLLLANSYSLLASIKQYQDELARCVDERRRQNLEAPKTLGDLFEAVIGAVYVDSECSIFHTWQVFEKLLPFTLDLRANSVRLKI